MILDNLKKLICKHPEVDLIIVNRLIYVKLMYEIHGSMKIKNVRIYSNEEVKVDEVELYGETSTTLKNDLRESHSLLCELCYEKYIGLRRRLLLALRYRCKRFHT